MRNYDFEKAKELIQQHSKRLAEAAMGMHEDWWWTSASVWENGEYCKELSDDTKICGLSGSSWATPTLHLIFKDGTEKMIPCLIGEKEEEKTEVEASAMLGCLSGPAQKSLPPLSPERSDQIN